MDPAVETPEGEVEYYRADGNAACAACQQPSWRHRVDEVVQRATGNGWDRCSGLILHVLCSGDRVKL